MNRIRIYTDILLGACISLLVGCHTQKKVTKEKQTVAEEPQEIVVSRPEVICLYGVPPEVYKKLQSSETPTEENDKQDDVEIQK